MEAERGGKENEYRLRLNNAEKEIREINDITMGSIDARNVSSARTVILYECKMSGESFQVGI